MTYLCFFTVGFDGKPDGHKHIMKYNGTWVSHDGRHYNIRAGKYILRAEAISFAGTDVAAFDWLKQ